MSGQDYINSLEADVEFLQSDLDRERSTSEELRSRIRALEARDVWWKGKFYRHVREMSEGDREEYLSRIYDPNQE